MYGSSLTKRMFDQLVMRGTFDIVSPHRRTYPSTIELFIFIIIICVFYIFRIIIIMIIYFFGGKLPVRALATRLIRLRKAMIVQKKSQIWWPLNEKHGIESQEEDKKGYKTLWRIKISKCNILFQYRFFTEKRKEKRKRTHHKLVCWAHMNNGLWLFQVRIW